MNGKVSRKALGFVFTCQDEGSELVCGLDADKVGDDGRREVSNDDEEGDACAGEEADDADLHGQLAGRPEHLVGQRLVAPPPGQHRRLEQEVGGELDEETGQAEHQHCQHYSTLEKDNFHKLGKSPRTFKIVTNSNQQI